MFTSFESLNSHYHTQRNLYNYISSQFKEFYIVNVDNLKFFSKSLNYKFSEELRNIPKNIFLINLKNSSDFEKFVSDKNLVIINNFGKSFKDLKIHMLIKRKNILQIQFKNIGNIQMDQIVSKTNLFLTLNYLIFEKLFQKITTFLSCLNIINKIDICFISNKLIYEKSKISKLNKFSFIKEFLLVNSKFQDEIETEDLSNKYIVHLDYYLNYNHETILRGNLDSKKLKEHHDCVQRFLLIAQKKLKKEVVIAVHPMYPTEYFQNFYSDFKIVKYKTAELIKDADLVTFFDSSAIVNAVLLNKKIIQLSSKHMNKNSQYHSTIYQKKLGLPKVEITNFYEDTFEKIYNQSTFDNDLLKSYVSNFHLLDNHEKGRNKIVKIIKEKYFSN